MSKSSYFSDFPFSIPDIYSLSSEVNSTEKRYLFYTELPFYYGNNV